MWSKKRSGKIERKLKRSGKYITKFSHPKIWVLEAENRTVGRRKIIKEIIEENVMSWKKDYEFQIERAYVIPSRMNGKRSASRYIW